MAKKEPKKIKGVTLHKSGKWMWRFQYENKSHCGYENTQAQAVKALEKAKYEIREGSYLSPDRIILDSYFEEWLETYVTPFRKQKTVEIYKTLYKLHISPEFGKIRIQEIERKMIQKWLNVLAKEYSAQTIKLTRTIFFMVLKSAVDDDIIRSNPVQKTKIPPLQTAIKKEALTKEQEDLFFEYCAESRFYVLFRFASLIGARIGELTALQWSDIDLEKGTVSITKTLCDSDEKGFMFNTPKSKASIRTLPMPPEATELIKNYITKEKENRLKGTKKEREDMRKLLFHTSTLAPLPSSVPNKELKMIADRMRADGIDLPENFTMHTLRHCFATRAVEKGMDLKTLSAYLGHSDIGITANIYVSSHEDKQREEIQKVANYL